MRDDENEALPPSPASAHSSEEDRKRKKMKLNKEEKVNEEVETKNNRDHEHSSTADDEGEETDPKPIGDVVRVSGKGRGRRSHYQAFEFQGLTYDTEDPVLLVPEDDENQQPYVTIIKDITQAKDGSMMFTGQRFYRPEEAEKKGGGNYWESNDTRELFYSFHRDEVPAEAVMHKCVIHFIPLDKKIPNRKKYPGFFVRKVYDTEQRRLFKLTHKEYEDDKQLEIDLLVQKTLSRLGDLSDIENEDASLDQEDQSKNKMMLKRKIVYVSSEDDETTRSGQESKAETPGGVACNSSEYYTILASFNALTGDTRRDKWLEKLLKELRFVCTRTDCAESAESSDKEKGRSLDKSVNDSGSFPWPEAAVSAVTALEKASNDALLWDFQKYNKKMRQLTFTLKMNALLARQLLNGDLEPSKILDMSPAELKVPTGNRYQLRNTIM